MGAHLAQQVVVLLREMLDLPTRGGRESRDGQGERKRRGTGAVCVGVCCRLQPPKGGRAGPGVSGAGRSGVVYGVVKACLVDQKQHGQGGRCEPCKGQGGRCQPRNSARWGALSACFARTTTDRGDGVLPLLERKKGCVGSEGVWEGGLVLEDAPLGERLLELRLGLPTRRDAGQAMRSDNASQKARRGGHLKRRVWGGDRPLRVGQPGRAGGTGRQVLHVGPPRGPRPWRLD